MSSCRVIWLGFWTLGWLDLCNGMNRNVLDTLRLQEPSSRPFNDKIYGNIHDRSHRRNHAAVNMTNVMAQAAQSVRVSKDFAIANQLLGNEPTYFLESNISDMNYPYLIRYLYQNNQQCSDTPSAMATYTLNSCYYDLFLNFAPNDSLAYYVINTFHSMTDNYILINTTYFLDDVCLESTSISSEINVFNRSCSLTEGAILNLESYYYNVSYSAAFPEPGHLLASYEGTSTTCDSEDVTLQVWIAPDTCYPNASTTSFRLTCSSNTIVTSFNYLLYDTTNCSGPFTVQTSNFIEDCDTTTIAVPFLQSCYGYPHSKYCVNESSLVYAPHGEVSIMGTLDACMKNMGGDIVFYPGYSTGEMVNVSVTVSLNNIIDINEIKNSISLDMYLYFSWTDFRLSMPALFDAVGLQSYAGIDITPAFNVQNIFGDTTNIWVPDVMFPDAMDVYVTDQFLRLNNGGVVDWNLHVVINLLESSFEYQDYPTDTQVVYIRFYSFSLYGYQVSYNPVDVEYMYSDNGEDSVTLNPVWNFESAVATFGIEEPGTFYGARTYGLVTMTLARQGTGLVLRLALPIFILGFLAALSFWASPDDRVNSTVTMLLAISALYIVVIQNIPMIGYLTRIDYFVTIMFFILFVCSVLHLLTLRLQNDDKISKWPIRKFYIRLLELIGRIFVVPIITSFYIVYFRPTLYTNQVIALVVFMILFTLLISFREITSLMSVLKRSMKDISEKFDKLNDMSMLEVIVFNYYTYGIYSMTLSYHVRQQAIQQRIEHASEVIEQQQRRKKQANYDSDDEVTTPTSSNPANSRRTSSGPILQGAVSYLRRPWSINRTSLDPLGLGLGDVQMNENPIRKRDN